MAAADPAGTPCAVGEERARAVVVPVTSTPHDPDEPVPDGPTRRGGVRGRHDSAEERRTAGADPTLRLPVTTVVAQDT